MHCTILMISFLHHNIKRGDLKRQSRRRKATNSMALFITEHSSMNAHGPLTKQKVFLSYWWRYWMSLIITILPSTLHIMNDCAMRCKISIVHHRYSGANEAAMTITGPSFFKHGLTLIPAWISNYILYKGWDEITYPFLNFNGATVEV